MPDKTDYQKQLQAARQEIVRLEKENEKLKAQLGANEKYPAPSTTVKREQVQAPNEAKPISPDEKVKIFMSLFRGRGDVYAVRWEGKNNKSGYSPACDNEWIAGLCKKPRVKCADCDNRQFSALTDEVVRNHLTGKQTIGVYPILTNETCFFLAVDFDKSSWREDASAYLETCHAMEVPAVLERSRSGNGAHVWIFFDRSIQASLVRKLGAALLTRTLEGRPEIGFDSYDRFFPSQDTMPKGGFGNLIAVPLQHRPREKGNSVFLDKELKPFPDQWEYLSSLQKMSEDDVGKALRKLGIKRNAIDVRPVFSNDEEEASLPALRDTIQSAHVSSTGSARIFQGNQVFIKREGLTPKLINALMKLAAFQNPEFYKAQSMRLSTYGKPRIISCAELNDDHVALPRGCLSGAIALLKTHSIDVEISDNRNSGDAIDVCFQGQLRDRQKKILATILESDIGIISAPTGFGKTVIAASVIAERKVNTLVLVHRSQLMDQWYERLSMFLDTKIGVIGAGKNKRTSEIDICMIQGLNRKGAIKTYIEEYGQVIVDECHHISAFTFEQILKRVKAKYVIGLTATPVRKDGHHPIITMQCGPVRYRANTRGDAKNAPYQHVVIPRTTQAEMPPGKKDYTIHNVYALITSNKARNDMIFDDLLNALEEGRSPLLLTERKEHLNEFEKRLKGFAKNVVVLKGGMGAKQRKSIMAKLKSIDDNEERVIIATGRYIGEGFDDARLDTLFLAMPISWRGTLQQYVGRLHRLHDNKKVVKVYDYVDANIPMLARMYEKRLKGYSALGYTIRDSKTN